MGREESLVDQGALSLRDAIRFTGLGRTTLYVLRESGGLRYCKVGARRLIPVSELKRLLSVSVVPSTAADGLGTFDDSAVRRHP